jgi:hypothetical protein
LREGNVGLRRPDQRRSPMHGGETHTLNRSTTALRCALGVGSLHS